MSQTAAKMTESRFPKITEEGLDDLRKRIGVADHGIRWAVESRSDARQHPSLRPWHRRR